MASEMWNRLFYNIWTPMETQWRMFSSEGNLKEVGIKPQKAKGISRNSYYREAEGWGE